MPVTLVGLVLSGALVWQASAASFSTSTSNEDNAFGAGNVTLEDDDAGTAMFAIADMKPGNAVAECVQVTYQGSLEAMVKLFVPPGGLTGTGLGDYLDVVIEEGAGGDSSSCTGFVPATVLAASRLSSFAAASTDSATGVGTFTPTGPGQTRTYRFTVTLAGDNAAQSRTAAVDFTWEATNT